MKRLPPFQLLRRAARLLLLAAVAAGCAGGSITRRTEVDDTGRRETSSSTEMRVFTNKDEAALDRARQDRRQGHYPEATAGFQAVYDNAAAKPEFRAQALFELARVNADLLNPRKDRAQAIALYEKFLAEYPASKQADEAREQLALLRGGTGN